MNRLFLKNSDKKFFFIVLSVVLLLSLIPVYQPQGDQFSAGKKPGEISPDLQGYFIPEDIFVSTRLPDITVIKDHSYSGFHKEDYINPVEKLNSVIRGYLPAESGRFLYHSIRILLIPIILSLLYFYISLFFSNSFYIKSAFILSISGGGFGGTYLLTNLIKIISGGSVFNSPVSPGFFGSIPVDLWVRESSIFYIMQSSIRGEFTIILILLFLISFDRVNSETVYRNLIPSFFLAILLYFINFNSFFIIIFMILMYFSTVVISEYSRKRIFITGSIDQIIPVIISAALFIIIIGAMIKSGSISGFYNFKRTVNIHVISFCSGFGILLITAFIGFFRVFRKRIKKFYPVVFW
ncbi:MAG: hypothetical protein KAS39_05640, partial [Actinomycetia bacterium]|nr:hypothetical protein [Actinomycetes bacterium]